MKCLQLTDSSFLLLLLQLEIWKVQQILQFQPTSFHFPTFHRKVNAIESYCESCRHGCVLDAFDGIAQSNGNVITKAYERLWWIVWIEYAVQRGHVVMYFGVISPLDTLVQQSSAWRQIQYLRIISSTNEHQFVAGARAIHTKLPSIIVVSAQSHR